LLHPILGVEVQLFSVKQGSEWRKCCGLTA